MDSPGCRTRARLLPTNISSWNVLFWNSVWFLILLSLARARGHCLCEGFCVSLDFASVAEENSAVSNWHTALAVSCKPVLWLQGTGARVKGEFAAAGRQKQLR